MTTSPTSTIQDFSGYQPTWCPGCGDWGIGAALKSAFVQMGHSPSSVRVVFGIGCSGNMNDFLNAYAIHSLHGRALPNAIGLHLSQHTSPTVAIVGDGDCYGEGGNHLISACRGNYDITTVVHDNGVYGLTTGQGAPTAQSGYKSKSNPAGTLEQPINPLALAISQGASFIGQAFAGNVPHMVEMIKKAVAHRGFSLLNVLQPCVTYNKINTYAYYQEHTYMLGDDYDPTDMDAAMKIALEMTFADRFALGTIYEVDRPTYADQLPQLADQSLASRPRFTDVKQLVGEFV